MADEDRKRDADDEEVLPDEQPLHREMVPGAWEHGGEVDQFEAELVAGAEGREAGEGDADDAYESDSSGAVDEVDMDAHAAASPAGPTGRGGTPAAPPGTATTGRGGMRFVQFLRASWAELQRVQWPDRGQVGQATAVVLGFVIIAGAYLGVADVIAQEIVDLII